MLDRNKDISLKLEEGYEILLWIREFSTREWDFLWSWWSFEINLFTTEENQFRQNLTKFWGIWYSLLMKALSRVEWRKIWNSFQWRNEKTRSRIPWYDARPIGWRIKRKGGLIRVLLNEEDKVHLRIQHTHESRWACRYVLTRRINTLLLGGKIISSMELSPSYIVE